jgi:hypothetical protein
MAYPSPSDGLPTRTGAYSVSPVCTRPTI